MKSQFLRPDFNTPITIILSNTAPTADAIRAAFGANKLRLASTVDCWVSIGTTPIAAAGQGIFLPAAHPEVFMVDPGDLVSAISDSMPTGKLNIVEMQG